jgi:rhamnosyltransferase
VLLGWLNDLRRDFAFCLRHRRLGELSYAARIRWEQRQARLEGFRVGWEFYRKNKGAVTPPLQTCHEAAAR